MRRFLLASSAVLALAAMAAPAHALPPRLKPVVLVKKPTLYVPQMMWFTPEVQMQLAAAGEFANAADGIIMFDLRGLAGTCTNQTGAPLNNKDPVGSLNVGGFSAETSAGAMVAVDNSGCPGSTMRFSVRNATTNTTGSGALSSYGVNGSVPGVVSGSVEHWAFIWHATEAGANRGVLLRNGAKVSDIVQDGTWSANLFAALSTNGFYINHQGSAGDATMELADVVVDTGHVLIDASNNPTFDVTRIYANGAPKDPGSKCEKYFGWVPLYCYTGAAASWATNKGTATTTFASVGANSRITAPFEGSAPGPGGVAAEPFMLWQMPSALSCTFSAGTCSTLAESNEGGPIELGNLIEVEVVFAENTHAAFHPITVTAGAQGDTITWSSVLTQSCTCGTGNLINIAIFKKVAEASDVTAAGANWLNHPVINWATPGNGDTFYGSVQVRTMVFKKSDGSTPVVDAAAISGASGNAAASGWPCPSVTPSAPNTRYVCGIGQYDQGFQGTLEHAPPAGYALRDKIAKGGSGDKSAIMDKRVTGLAAVAPSWSASANPSNPTYSWAELLK